MRLVSAWRDFWFRPVTAFNLGAVRFLLCSGGAVFYFFLSDLFPDGFYSHWAPISFYQLMPGPIDLRLLGFIRYAWLFFTFLAGLGVAFRLTITLGFLCGLFFQGYSYNFGWVYHSAHIYTMALGILAFSKAGDGFRIFNIRREVSEPSSDYRWPIQLIKSYVAYVFFLCGLQKVMQSGGLGWAFSDSFYDLLLSIPDQPPLSLWIQSQPVWVSQLFAAGALLGAELSAPLSLINRRTGVLYFCLWAIFHTMVTATFGVHRMFFSQILAYVAFIDWEFIWGKLGRRLFRKVEA